MNTSSLADRLGRRINIIQGECRISPDPGVVLTTVLGSCVAACLHDPVASVGGMNHFLLPDGDDGDQMRSLRYGAYAMELLVNGMLTLGARRERLEAKLFGGARLMQGLTDIGSRNAAFAENYLRREGIQFLGGSLGGAHARKLQCWPASGRVRQLVLSRKVEVQPVQIERDRDGGVEFF